MKASIIIPTLNEERHLPVLLKAIKHQNNFNDYEIIVADYFSKDKTREIAAEYGAIVTDGGNISTGRNNGAKVANGDILVFMDSDIHFNTDFLQQSFNEFESKKLDIAIPKFASKNMRFTSKALYKLSDFTKEFTKNSKSKFGTSQCLFVKKIAFEEIKGFSENVSIGEDIDFFQKISKSNFKYDVLKTKIIASDRRFKSTGIIRVLVGSLFIAIIVGFSLQNRKGLQNLTEKIYGGWGKW